MSRNDLGLDPTKFKHVSSDDKKTILRHKDGHTLTIAHNTLSPKMQIQLKALSGIGKEDQTSQQAQDAQYGKVTKLATGGPVDAPEAQVSRPDKGWGAVIVKGKSAMAEGGEASPDTGIDRTKPRTPSSSQSDIDANEQNASNGWSNFKSGLSEVFKAHGGEVAKFAEGTKDGPVDSDADSQSTLASIKHALKIAAGGPTAWGRAAGLNPGENDSSGNFVPSGVVDDNGPEQQQPVPDQSQQVPAQTPAPVPQQMMSQQPVPQDQSQQMTSQQPDESQQPNQSVQPQQDTQPAQAPTPMAAPQPTPDQVAQQHSVRQLQAVQNDPNTPAPIKQAPAPVQQQYQQHKEIELQDMHKEADEFQNDLKDGHITPKTYQSLFADKSTLGKVGTIFGLLLSGAGSGLTHQPNAVFEAMNNQINNDLHAQMKSKENAQNFYRLSMQHEQNKSIEANTNVDTQSKAYALAKMRTNYAALHELIQQTGKLPQGSPQRQQAEQTLAMLNGSIQNENYSLADRAATATAYQKMVLGNPDQPQGNQQGAQNIPDPAKEIRRRALVGAIQPDQANKALDEVGKVENHRKVNQTVLDSFDSVAKMATLGSKIANPIQNQKRIDAEWDPTLDKLTKDTEGRVTPITVSMMTALKPQLTDNANTTAIKRQKLNSILNSGYATPTLDSFNVKVDKGEANNTRQPQSQATPQIKIDAQGNKWQRGPNGEAVRVK